jgi:glycosyltransferase involved in cell wall biosynthesis
MARSPALTVITPTLNAEAYLAECLASVQDQSVPGVEHLVVDGGSTDRTAEIAQAVPGVKWVAGPGLRQTAAINAGVRLATGSVVAWLNADDLYLPGAVHSVLDRFAAEPTLALVYGDCQVIGPAGETLWWERPGPYDFPRLLRRGNYIAQPAAFIRRSAFDQLGLLDETLDYGMDYDFWLRLRGQNVAYMARPMAAFRWHPDSKSARGQMQSWREFLLIVRRHGGGWTPAIAWAYVRCGLTIARTRVGASITGATPVRPVTRGSSY